MTPVPMWTALVVALLSGCGGAGGEAPSPPSPSPTPPTANPERALLATALDVDVGTRSAVATLRLAPSASAGATLEVGDLVIEAVERDGQPLPWARHGDRLDLGLPALPGVSSVSIRYRYQLQPGFTGASAAGFTFTWPAFCGNLFPCHSEPAQGQDLSLVVRNPPAGQRVVQPEAPLPASPAYQLAWAVGDYSDLDLGVTPGGTRLLASYLPGQRSQAQQGTRYLRAAFEWLEQTLGPYRFGATAGPVAVAWGGGAYGGIEHHPRWHVGAASLADPEVHVHEAIHGWFGNGVRLACWEDFVLSEGTTSYLTARALDVVAPEVGARTWASYATRLRNLQGSQPVWPASCGRIDVLQDGLYSDAPYMRGAFFYRAVADRVGAAVLDRALARFYRRHGAGAAGMQDMLGTIAADTGFDPTACAQRWLRESVVPTPGPCS